MRMRKYQGEISRFHPDIVPGTGVEPARPMKDTRPSTLRVYQFRHPGWDMEK